MKKPITYDEQFIRDFKKALVSRNREVQETRARQMGSRMYQAAKASRLTSGWAQTNTSADSELISSIRNLRARSRALVRDAAYAKRAKVIVMNNIVGSGIGLQARVKIGDRLYKRINDEIEAAWDRWCRADSCHTGGTLHFSDLERAAMGQVFEAGEIFIRKHYRRFGDSEIPFALEMIEPERVDEGIQPWPASGAAVVRMGVEVDEFHRPVAYWIRQLHPGETRLTAQATDMIERVPAEQIIHLRLVDRWPQTRGEPWMHAVIRKLNDMDGYSEAEIVAARGAASYMGVIETSPDSPFGEENEDGTQDFLLEPGIVERLNIGEQFKLISPNRPNSALDPFMRYMLREVAAGVGVSYESLSRDYSQSNYSSSRLALLDDRDLWQMLQRWFIRSFREPLHREWMNISVLSGVLPAIGVEAFAGNPEKYTAVRFKPRGWSWIDPTKEVAAYKEAVKAGFTTVSHVIAITGNGADLEDVLDERRDELNQMKEKDLRFDTDPGAAKDTAPQDKNPQDSQPQDGGDAGGDLNGQGEGQGQKAHLIALKRRSAYET